MTSLYDSHDYYKRMFELQEKLRKSEEERIRLEERFNVLVRESRSRHDVCINRLRMKYIQHLEEQRTRDERNHKLLVALDRVTNKLALISAKKDRLNVLRKQYETYLLRVYSNRRPPGSITGDSGIASQNEDKCPRSIIATAPRPTDLAETRDAASPRARPAPLQTSHPRFTLASKFHDSSSVNNALSHKSTILPTAPTAFGYERTDVQRTPYVYVTATGHPSVDQFVQAPSAMPDPNQYSRVASSYDGGAPSIPQSISDSRVRYATTPILRVTSPDQTDHLANIVPANRFFSQPQAGAATQAKNVAWYEAMPSPRQFDPAIFAQSLQQRDTVASTFPDRQSRPTEYLSAQAVSTKSSVYPLSLGTVDQVGQLPGYADYVPRSPHKSSEDEGSVRSLTSDDVDDLMRRNEHILWRHADVAGKTIPSNGDLDQDDRMTAILEKELDRYISNIRKLHRDHGVPTQGSQEEPDHEQNTSGDLLNVTLSEDAAELPVEDRARRVPEEMDKILALASDLASETAKTTKIARQTGKNDGDEARGTSESGGCERGVETRRDIVSMKSKRPHEDARIMKEDRNGADSTIGARSDDAKRETITSSNDNVIFEAAIDGRKSAPQEKRLDFVAKVGEQLDIDGVFDTVEELAPWDLASVQKSVRELRLDEDVDDGRARALEEAAEETMGGEIGEEVAGESPISRDVETERPNLASDTLPSTAAKGPNESEAESREEVESSKVPSGDQREERESGEPTSITSRVDEELDKFDANKGEKREDVDVEEPSTTHIDDRPVGVEADSEYVEREYVEGDPNQAQQYEPQDPSAQYHYSQDEQYQTAGVEEYERYADQGYAQNGQEYVEYVGGQYGQYVEDPNAQSYQDDPNAQYEQSLDNQQYSGAQYEQDPNQAYGYEYDQQYDPSQEYMGDPGQTYEYAEGAAYNPDQTYDPVQTYEHEYEEEQQNPVVGAKESCEAELPEEVRRQSQPKSEGETTDRDADEDRSQRQADAADGEPTGKKKDVIKSLLDSDTDTTIEKNVSNTESDFDFN